MTAAIRDSRGWLLLLSLLVIVADRVTKWLASTRVEMGNSVTVIAHVFAISHVENPGAAFSLFNDSSSPARVRWMLLIFSLLAAVAMLAALPLALGAGTGSELRRPLGIAIVGGLLVSQVLTLYTTPVIYLAFSSLQRRFWRPRSVRAPAE